jgi:hypothetical protein
MRSYSAFGVHADTNGIAELTIASRIVKMHASA